MSSKAPILVWFRRDLRLGDHPALDAACKSGRPVIPVFIRDALVDGLGAAPKWRLGQGIAALDTALREKDSRLVLRAGNAWDALEQLIAETGADTVYWTRAYDPDCITRDSNVKSALKEAGLTAKSFGGHLMFEPWTSETKTGGFYKVYTPFWKTNRDRDVDTPLATPGSIPAPDTWPHTESVDAWQLGAAMNRGGAVVAQYANVGERAASSRLGAFIANGINGYDTNRDLPWKTGTSNLSENLALGEISPNTCWHAGQKAMHDGKAGAETFLKELVWREFAYHLMFHTPRILTDNWREGWDAFPWNTDERSAEIKAWKQGRTGIRFVDSAMREMYVTGRMHNRARMIAASYLTKHLMSHWKVGQKWFEDCLIDWDPASNAMGWQWSAGSGPDATPYFRVFNPVSQLDKFDKDRKYVSTWLAEPYSKKAPQSLQYFEAIPRSWNMAPDDDYPAPIVAADVGRTRALDAYKNREF